MVYKFNPVLGNQFLCEFMLKHQFWLESLPSLDADESYLRATTVRFIGIVLENQRTREALFSHTELVSNYAFL